MSKNTIGGHKDRRSKKIQRNTSESGIKCVCLNARSIINKKTELNIMVDDIKPDIIGITESWANNDIIDAELGLEGYVMFRKDRMGRRGGGVLLYIKETIPAYEVQLQEEADCKEAMGLTTEHGGRGPKVFMPGTGQFLNSTCIITNQSRKSIRYS